MKNSPALGLICVLLMPGFVHPDGFQDIKKKLGRTGCHYFEFYSIIESDIFDVTDTAAGTAYIASDGCYSITVADEHYIYDHEAIYTYSQSAGQVIIDPVAGDAAYVADGPALTGEEISFILNLDEIYTTETTSRVDRYHLVKKGGGATAYPDSLNVSIDTTLSELKQFEYFDVNEELNRIVFRQYRYEDSCDSARFELQYPDTVEVIRLPEHAR
jgi:outer membrane lipoprotein-sorting protein